MLARISRTGQICAECSDVNLAWKNCPNNQVVFAHHCWHSRLLEFPTNGKRKPLQKRFLNQPMATCSTFRAIAHMVGHLHTKRDYGKWCLLLPSTALFLVSAKDRTRPRQEPAY